MIKLFFIALLSFSFASCNNNSREVMEDNRIALHSDTLNVVKLTDTLVIYQATCRGCEFERSTNFAISDSMNIIKLEDVITTDNSPDDMDGGSVSKDLILVPLKPGTTIMKLYKFWTMEKTAKDSARFTTYKIEVKQ
jgi:hypothetical protein